jgi:hypothetical protein
MKLPQLHLRDLFWLVLVVALGCGWWVHQHRLNDSLNVTYRDLKWWPTSVGERLEVYVEEQDGEGVEILTFDPGNGRGGTYRAGPRNYERLLLPLKSRRYNGETWSEW